MAYTDLIGKAFGRVVVLERTSRRSGDRQVLWLCDDGKLRRHSDLKKMAKRAAKKAT